MEVAVDDPKGKIESKLKAVFIRINRLVVSDREQDRRRDAWNREWKQQQAREDARIRRKENARKRRERLYSEVQQWQHAETIRAYVAQVAASASVSAHDAALTRIRLWQNWARSLADQLDPTPQRCSRLHSGPSRTTRTRTDEKEE